MNESQPRRKRFFRRFRERHPGWSLAIAGAILTVSLLVIFKVWPRHRLSQRISQSSVLYANWRHQATYVATALRPPANRVEVSRNKFLKKWDDKIPLSLMWDEIRWISAHGSTPPEWFSDALRTGEPGVIQVGFALNDEHWQQLPHCQNLNLLRIPGTNATAKNLNVISRIPLTRLVLTTPTTTLDPSTFRHLPVTLMA